MGAQSNAKRGRRTDQWCCPAAFANPSIRQRLADIGQEIPRVDQQKPRDARCFSKSRNQKMVADHQGGGHQGGVNQEGHGNSRNRILRTPSRSLDDLSPQ
jgi:hypothetical protein